MSRGTVGARALLLVLVGCPAAPSSSLAEREGYLESAAFRRARLVESLVNPDNGYSRVRLHSYASGNDDDWDRLPAWNPAVEPIEARELDGVAGAPSSEISARAAALPLDDGPALADLVALGHVAFARYPVQLAGQFAVALRSRQAAARYGLWVDEARGVGGLVRARMADGSVMLSLTCASCHSARGAAAVEDGLPNSRLELGATLLDSPLVSLTEDAARAIALWGPGRLDVSTTTGREPARIPDLRPVRWLSHLQQDATVAMPGISALAVRIETLIITSYGQTVRPPRLIALALAAYVLSLADTLPDLAVAEATHPRGADLFHSRCSGCHAGSGLTSAPVAVAEVGTDSTLGRSAERGTGFYRVPSLRGVGSREALLHDGTLGSLPLMFDEDRLRPDFSRGLHGPGAVAGHPYGLVLAPSERAELVSFLQAL